MILVLWLLGCVKHEYPDGRGLTGQLEREVVALQQKQRVLEANLATCATGGPPDPLYADLAQILVNDDVTLERRGAAIHVTIPSDRLYGDGVTVRLEAARTLDLLGAALKSHPDHTVMIEVHTSTASLTKELKKTYANDWALGFARASALMSSMVFDFGLQEQRFLLVSRGSVAPVATEDTPSGLDLNERVVLILEPKGAR